MEKLLEETVVVLLVPHESRLFQKAYTFTRPDIVYALGIANRYMEEPKQEHYTAAKRILSYIQGSVNNMTILHTLRRPKIGWLYRQRIWW